MQLPSVQDKIMYPDNSSQADDRITENLKTQKCTGYVIVVKTPLKCKNKRFH